MPLPVIDGNGAPASLKTTVDGSDLVPHHKVDGTVACTQSGTWNAGLSAGSNEIGSIAAITEGAVPGAGARVGGANLPVSRAFSNVASGTTDGVLKSALSGKIRVVALILHCGATATSITLNSKGAGAGTAISGLHALAANGSLVLPFNPNGWFETNTAEALTATTTGGGTAIAVEVQYVEAT